MKTNECCKIRYEAKDGELFDTQKECRIYNETPILFLVIEFYENTMNCYTETIDSIHLTEESAKNYIGKHKIPWKFKVRTYRLKKYTEQNFIKPIKSSNGLWQGIVKFLSSKD